MTDLIVALRADEMPGERQSQREARAVLWKLLSDAADRIEELETALQEAYRHIDECCPHRIPNDARAALGEKTND